MSCRGIIFDMDGVLCDSEPFLAEAAVEMFRHKYQLEVKAEEFEPFVGTGGESYLRGVADQHRITLEMPGDKQAMYEAYIPIIRGRMQPIFGVAAFVNCAVSNGQRIALASSADWVKVEANLREIGLPPEMFDAVVCGDDVERKKPDPQIFNLAAERLELSTQDCLVIEDSPAGCRAAKSAGATCLGITSSFDDQTLIRAGADWTAKDLGRPCEEVVTW